MKSNTIIKKGYKKTAVGVIPEEWEVKRLGEIGLPKMCKRIFKEQTNTNEGIPFYKIGTFGGVPDAFITKELFDEYKERYSFPKKGDILISAAGTIGRLVVYDGEPAYFQDSNIVWIDNNEELISNKLLYYIYSIVRWQKTEGGIVSRLYNSDLKNVSLPIPPLPEQQAIANCLTTWDSGIEKLTQLIAAKREQKKGLMQQLLTGKKRLDGFVGEWKEVKIGKLGETFNGLTGKTKKDFGEGKPYVTYLNTFRQNCIDENTSFDYVKINDNENQSTLKYGDLIFTTSSETPNEVGMSSVILFHPKDSLYLNSFCFGLRLENFETLHPSFATFMLRGNDFRREMYKLAQGSTRFNLSKASFKKITVKLPPIEEQTAIAHILTTADKEIELLEKKLEAMKEEKKGLMQVLLTGKKRLIDS